MEVRRIGPDGGFLREFTDVRKRVQHLETRPSGNIVIRETLTATDPDTGVSTQLGVLPDGSIGFQPFIGDIVPPPVATQPVVSAQPGMFTVSWDGLFVNNEEKPRDFEHVNVIGHKMDGAITTLSLSVGVLRLATDTVFVAQDIAGIGETWQFSLESEDYNGNLAVRGARSPSIIMQSTATDAGVTAALEALQADADAAAASALAAQGAADTAQGAADDAADSALEAANLAATKGKILYQTTAPTGADANALTLWIDTTGGANTPKRWVSGTTWAAVTDKVATDAAALAATKTKTYFQPASPALTGNTTGDLWFDTDDNNKPYVWNGTAWTVAQDATINKSIFGTFSTDIDQTQPNKWLYTRYDKTGLVNNVVPSYLDIVGLAGTSSLIADGAQLVVNVGDQYIGQLRTIVNIATSKTIAVTATHDDGAQIYVDGVSVYTKATYTAGAAISFSISAGWHVIDMLWLEAAGGDGWSNISPTFGSQFTSMFAPVSLTATSAAVSAAQTAATNAMNAQAYSLNASFDDWTGAFPTGYATWGSTTPIKETTIIRRAPFALRYNCADTTTQAGILLNSIVNHAANLEYVTVELEFQLVSGTLGGSGLLIDWNATNYVRSTVSLLTEVPSAETGKWYRVTKVLRRPAGLTGTFTKISGYLMAQYSSGMGTQATKNLVFDWLNIRPATTEEITAYGTPASITTVTDLANSKGKVLIQSTTPAVGDQLAQNLWIDTTSGLNTPKRWNGSIWVTVTDKVATDAASAAAAAQTKADQAFNNAATAATAAGNAQTTADGKNRVWYVDTEPAGTGHALNDIWFDTNDGNKPYRWTGSIWTVAQDAAIAAAQSKADTAFSVANGKNTTYYQPAQPSGGTYIAGDLWFDTDADYKLYTYTGSAWQATQDAAAAKSEAITAAATDATAKADAAQMAAIQAQAYSLNPSFEDWPGTIPTHYTTFVTNPTKETTTIRTGKNAVRFNCTDSTTNRGLQFNAALAHAPYFEYLTVELEVRLVSGTSFGGAGVLVDWTGMSGANRATISLATEIPSPSTGKWYRMTKVIRKPTTATGTLSAYSAWLMGQYSTGMGTQAVKDIIFDWINVRPATTEEITAYGTPASITTLTDTVNTKTKTYFQPASPALTGNTTGDIWFDTDDGNKPYVWNGAAWTDARDTTIAAAQGTANSAVTAANGKNKVIYSTSAASGTTGYVAGDTWFQRDGSNNIIGQWEFTTSWQTRQLAHQVVASIDAAKITVGTLDVANRIAAGSLTTNKIAIGDFTNLVDNGTFETDFTGWTNTGATITTTSPYSGTKSASFSGSNNIVQDRGITVTPGEKLHVSVYYKASADKAGPGGLRIRNQSGGEGVTWSGGYDVGTATAWTLHTGVATVTSGTTVIYPRLAFALTAGNVQIDNFVIRRMTGAVLIEDGAIQAGSLIVANGAIGNAQIADLNADKITAGTIAADRLDAETIKSKLIAASYITASDIFATGSITSASGIFGTMDASVINAGTIAADRLDAETVKAKLIDASLINAVDIIAQNSITATNGIIGSLDVSKVTTGTMSGSYITAKTLTANKLVITSTDNLVVEADFGNGGASWELGANKSINATAGRGSLPAFRVTGSTAQITALNLVNRVSVGAEDRFRASAWVKSTAALGAGAVQVKLRCYTTATAFTDIIAVSSPALVANTWTNISGISPVLPTNTVAIEFYLAVTNNATGTITDIDYVGVTRAADGNLVVDGAMDAKSITGATIKTAASGARVLLDTTGIYGYDSLGVNYLSGTAAGLSLTGQLKAHGITDDDVNPEPMTVVTGNLDMPDTSWDPIGVHFVRDGWTLGTYTYTPPRVFSFDGTDLQLESATLDIVNQNPVTYASINLQQGGHAQLHGSDNAFITAGNFIHLQTNIDNNGYVRLLGDNSQLGTDAIYIGKDDGTSIMDIRGASLDIQTYGIGGIDVVSGGKINFDGSSDGVYMDGAVYIQNRKIVPVRYYQSAIITSFPPHASLWGPGQFAMNAAASYDGDFVSIPGNDLIDITETGVYAFEFVFWPKFLGVNQYVRALLQKQNGGNWDTLIAGQRENDSWVWEWGINRTTHVVAGSRFRLNFIHDSGATREWDTQMMITKVR